jgi:hypothetical protein
MFTKIEWMDKKPPVLLINCDRLLLVNLVRLHAMAVVYIPCTVSLLKLNSWTYNPLRNQPRQDPLFFESPFI